MSRQIPELQQVLRVLIDEHRKLLVQIDRQRAAMQALNIREIDASRLTQEEIRQRIGTLDNQRRHLTAQIALAVRQRDLTLTQIAAAFPGEAKIFLSLRDELRAILLKVQHSNNVAGRLAGAVLGHLNTVARIVANAIQPSGVYTRQRVPKISPRLGVIKAVG